MKRRDIKLNTVAHREAFNAFYDAFSEIEGREGLRGYEVLARWLEAGFYAMRSAVLKLRCDDKGWKANEAAYMAIVKGMRYPKETMSDMAQLTTQLVLALEAEPIDFLGPVFSEIAADAHMGQFFTPWALSETIARMTFAGAERIAADRPLFCCEPAVGVGGMVLAASKVLREKGVNISTRVHWEVWDVDFRAMCGAYMQLNLCGVSADVIHGNTLSLERRMVTPTLAALTFPKLTFSKPPPRKRADPNAFKRKRATP